MVEPMDRSAIFKQVIADLDERAMRFKDQNDPRQVFTLIYRMITEGILTHLLDPQLNQGFDDPHWLANLDRKFAEYYIKASDAFDRNDPTPRVWREVFKRIGAGLSKPPSRPPWTILKEFFLSLVFYISMLKMISKVIGLRKSWDVLQALLLPMVAHIMHDLVFALADSNAGPENEADHQKVTDLLCTQIDGVQQTSAEYAPLLALLDEAAGHLNEAFTCYIVRRMRDLAWADGLALRAAQGDEEKRAAIITSVEEKALGVIKTIRTNPLSLPGKLDELVLKHRF